MPIVDVYVQLYRWHIVRPVKDPIIETSYGTVSKTAEVTV